MLKDHNLLKRLIKKAAQSDCRYKVSAAGFNKNNDLICITNNQHRFNKHGGSIHAEMRTMANYNVSKILICRVNTSGKKILPITPCESCKNKADELGIEILTLNQM